MKSMPRKNSHWWVQSAILEGTNKPLFGSCQDRWHISNLSHLTLQKFYEASFQFQQVLTIVNSEKVMELTFHPKNEVNKIKFWTENIENGILCANSNSTILDQIKFQYGIEHLKQRKDSRFRNMSKKVSRHHLWV